MALTQRRSWSEEQVGPHGKLKPVRLNGGTRYYLNCRICWKDGRRIEHPKVITDSLAHAKRWWATHERSSEHIAAVGSPLCEVGKGCQQVATHVFTLDTPNGVIDQLRCCDSCEPLAVGIGAVLVP